MMAFLSCPAAVPLRLPRALPLSLRSPSMDSISFFPSHPQTSSPGFLALRATGADGEPTLLRRPAMAAPPVAEEGFGEEIGRTKEELEEEEESVDWEDRILQDTVPLVGFVRMILHSGKYQSGDKLSPEHEKLILERVLPYHPECEKKIGCGIDFITIGFHPQYENSRCLFIVRKDGELVDFSYWKCIKGLIRKNYPLYADTFILRHFRRQRHDE